MWESRGKIFHSNEKVIRPWPNDHNSELWVLTVTEPLGKPLHLRHLAKYSPLLSTLYKKWLLFSPLLPTAYDFKLIYTEEKKILLKKQEIRHCVIERENSSSCLCSETMKPKPQNQVCSLPWCSLWVWQGLKILIIHTITHWKGCVVFK